MMSLKETINQIFNNNTNYLHAQQILNQARSLKSLSNDLYTDPLRFVYELVQNCDDACQPKSIVRIAIVDHHYLIVGHNGKPFDREDVQSLCDIGCSTKGEDMQKTGYKGLGFKAVFGKSDYILIVSKGEYFRFEANSKVFQWNPKWGINQITWEQINNRKFEFPWQICPIWTEKNEIPESIQKWLLGQSDTVATIIRLKNVEETQNAIRQLTDQSHVFMFLRNIRTVRFSFNSSNETSLNITILRDGSVKVVYDWHFISHWLLCTCNIDVPDNARNDFRLPEKLQNAKQTEIILAAKIDRNDNIGSVKGHNNALFAYLPTKITTYDLPILVNANFLTNASREHIHTDSVWNQFLFSRIPHEMLKWIGTLGKQSKWRDKALDLLPNHIDIKDNLATKYNENCSNAATEVPFVLNTFNKLLKVSEAAIDVTGFSNTDCIGNDLIRDFILRTISPTPRIAQYPFVHNSRRLRKFNILVFDWDKCLDMLNSDDFQMNITTEQDIRFIIYLFNNQHQQQIEARLRKLPFLMDHMGKLRMTKEIFIPSHFNNTDWVETNDIDPYVHDNIMLWLQTEPLIFKWLKSLGVMEKTDEIFINQKIIPRVHNYITLENALPTVKKLFNSFQRGEIHNDLLHKLNKLKLFSLENTLVSADELYFSDEYLPRLSLSNFHLNTTKFLSPIYLNEINNIPNKIKEFFLLLNVQEDIKLIRFSEDQHNEIVSAYRFKQTENLFQYNSLQFQYCLTLPFLDITQTNYDFALYFWQHVIYSINNNQLNEKETLICNQQQLRKIDNLPYWFVRARSCIPTTTKQLLKSTDVFSSDLKLIAGDLLPVFACTTSIPFSAVWQRFFQFKTEFSIQDHIQLLNLLYDRLKNISLDDEYETCIQRVYTSMIKCLSSFDRKYFDQYRPKAPLYLLSTINNEFLPSTNLVLSLNKDIILPNQIPQLKLSTGNSRDSNLICFLDFFNIRQIGINDLTLTSNINAQPSLFLRAKLRDMQVYLFELTNSRNIKNHCIDYDLEIFEVDRLDLYYNETIPVLQIHIHIIDNRLYVTRPWNSNEVMLKLPQILCKQFKLPLNIESDIRQFLLNETIIHSMTMMPSSLKSSIDLLNIDGTRGKFAMIIDRDNEQLFNHLGIINTTSSAELLIKALNAQISPFAGYVYHYTHLENAASILRDHAIKSRNNLSSNNFKDSAAKDVIQKTRIEVKDYARFYFRPLTPTQYCNENLGLPNLSNQYGNQPMCPIPIIFRIDLAAILSIKDIQWKVSLGNMASPQTEFDNTLNIVKRFDFQGVFFDICTDRGKYSSQQEFLIKSQLNFDQLKEENITIIFQDENARYSLERMILYDYPSNIDTTFFYGFNSRIIIRNSTDIDNAIDVYINDSDSSRVYGRLILQLSGQNENRTIQGILNASFQRGNILTVYTNQQFSFINNINDTQYAIFYEYENQVWLIHTNSPQVHFISPT
ncbi:unnamed protein product [Rotaria sordida]|uniref:Sacsin n=1 Tax=Rotaria sordida TaxID=392033 RepID=A0A813WF98_9BILA|nr:unnamed protein product [Rotaria sordida]CAF0857053.1 unnamed protein product [Rotaria sordida]